MTRWTLALITVFSLAGTGLAYAQETPPGPGTVEVTVIPGGGMFFTSSDKGPSFGNYSLGAGVTYNINRLVGFEGEVGGTLGIAQDLQLGAVTANLKTPNLLSYTGNVVVYAPTRSSIVPYATGGIGGLTMFDRASLGINTNTTFLTGNVGGGVKWYAPSGRWGLRGDYRFITVKSNDTAPAFFGQDTRYGHRVYGAVVINALQ